MLSVYSVCSRLTREVCVLGMRGSNSTCDDFHRHEIFPKSMSAALILSLGTIFF